MLPDVRARTARTLSSGTTPHIVGDVLASASGAELRDDPVLPRTGGPAGNARLTAWTGVLLLAGCVAECVTLLSLHAMLTAHIFIGAILVPLVLLKTATTGWRITRYYSRSEPYRSAGPPPLLLRMLGPLVVLAGFAVLGSGLALIPLGQSSFTPMVRVDGQGIDAVTLHKLCFVVWFVVTGAHVLARSVTALQLVAGYHRARDVVPGRAMRCLVVVVTLAASVATGFVVVNLSSSWTNAQVRRFDRVGGQSDGLRRGAVPTVPGAAG